MDDLKKSLVGRGYQLVNSLLCRLAPTGVPGHGGTLEPSPMVPNVVPFQRVSDLNFEYLRDFHVKTSIPVILRPDRRPLSQDQSVSRVGELSVELLERRKVKQTELYLIGQKIVGTSLLYGARFKGRYRTGFLHIDALPTYNVYRVDSGRKDVIVVSVEGSRRLPYDVGTDSLFVPGTADQSNDQVASWLDRRTRYYRFALEAGDILIFNNSGCAHKFTNLTGREVIRTYRYLNRFYRHPRIAELTRKKKNRDHIASTLLEGSMRRNPLLA
jgi:hypothetical protein